MQRYPLLLLFILAFCLPAAGSAQNYAKFSNIKAGMKDHHLEEEALWLANKRASTTRCREEFIWAKIVSDDWEIERTHSGIITGRHLHMELYGESKDGHCGVSHCVFRQKVQGDNTYSPKLKLADMGPFYDLDCE